MTGGASEYGIRISRVFDATRERVWREWTEPERFADWYGGPQCEIPLDSVGVGDRLRVKPGGKIPVDGTVQTGEALVSLPGYKSELRLGSGVGLLLWGALPEMGLPPPLDRLLEFIRKGRSS